MAEERSSGLLVKIIGGIFGAVIAPILVAVGIKYSDRLFAPHGPLRQVVAPASPAGGAVPVVRPRLEVGHPAPTPAAPAVEHEHKSEPKHSGRP